MDTHSSYLLTEHNKEAPAQASEQVLIVQLNEMHAAPHGHKVPPVWTLPTFLTLLPISFHLAQHVPALLAFSLFQALPQLSCFPYLHGWHLLSQNVPPSNCP